MISIIYNFIFLLITLFILLKVIGYAIYEIKQLKNKVGGIVIISFSSAIVLLVNIIMWIR